VGAPGERARANLRLVAGRCQSRRHNLVLAIRKRARGLVEKSLVTLCRSFPLNPTEMSEIAEKVKAIIIDKLGVEASEVTPEASFTNDLGADSLDTVELIMEFEKEFNVSIPDDQAENIGTVGQAISYLEEHAK
jgi:acyl carrier protein